MCGIAGIFDRSGRPVEAGDIEVMNSRLSHRGPDDNGVHCVNGLGLGSTRLSILDPTPAGHMPMVELETGNGIVHNGEIYNFKELPAALGLGPMKTRTDTEVILKAYAKLGPECVRHFNGIFAFAVWDARRQTLFCARDRLGVKPFFFHWDGSRFHFASEAKALFAVGIRREPNLGIIHDYLAHGVYDHARESFFKGVEQLPPAHTLTMSRKGLEIARYWDIDPDRERSFDHPPVGNGAFSKACDEFTEIVRDSIRLQLRSDVPIALHVSGGLDSNLLMGAVREINGGQGRIKAFSHNYGEKRYDEKPYAEALARALDWEVEYHNLDAVEVPSLAEETMWHQEQPFPGLVTLAKQKLIKSTQTHGAKVVLEGQGGDEIAGGYQYYFGPFMLDLIQAGRPDEAVGELREFSERNDLTPDQGLRKAVNGLSAFYRPGRSADGTQAARPECLHPDFAAGRDRAWDFAQPFRSNLLNMQYRDIFHTKLPRILRSCDRASMAYGRELRVPLLDHRLVEFSFSLPSRFKIGGGVQRRFMREALKRWLPAKLGEAPKRAVVDPLRNWLKGPLRPWVSEIISSKSFRTRGLFDVKKVDAAYADYVAADSPENAFHVWQWVSMELWYRTFIDGDGSRPPGN